MNILRTGLDFAFFSLFKWFSWQERSDPADKKEAQYLACGILAFLGTALAVIIQVSIVYILHPRVSLDWLPVEIRYAWTFPIWIFVTYKLFLNNNRWLAVVNRFEILPAHFRYLGYSAVLTSSFLLPACAFAFIYYLPANS